MEPRPISSRALARELNSEAFTSLLERAIRFTDDTGSEASFSIDYIPSRGAFHYPARDIDVGTRHTVSSSYPLNLPAANEAYKQKIGLPLPHPQNKEWLRRKEEIPQEQYDKEWTDGSR